MTFRQLSYLVLAVAFAGCSENTYITIEPDPVPDPAPEFDLTVEPGSMEDLTLLFGSYDAEFVRLVLTSRSTRPIEFPSMHAAFYGTDGFPLTGSVRDLKFVSARGRRVQLGPTDEVAGAAGEAHVEFTDSFTLYPGEQIVLVLRADLPEGYERTEFDLEIGLPDGELLPGLRYADTGEVVPVERIANNYSIVRHLSIRSMEEMTESGSTALVSTFQHEVGILNPSSVWQLLGTLVLDSYGGDSVFRGAEIFGANIGTVTELTLARDEVIVGEITVPSGACSCGQVRMREPLVIGESERVILEVWGRIPAVPEFLGELTFGFGVGYDAEAVDGGDFNVIIASAQYSIFRVFSTHPVVRSLAVSSTTLVNGLEQDLYRMQVSSSVDGESLNIGSLTFRLAGGSGGSVSNLYIRLGSTLLSRALYRLVRTATGEEIGPTDSVSAWGEQVTIVFTEPDGLLITGTGYSLTLVGTPSGFVSGDALNVGFGDYVFTSHTNVSGNITPAGRITNVPGEIGLVDPIVWRTPSFAGGIFTGAWWVDDLNARNILTR